MMIPQTHSDAKFTSACLNTSSTVGCVARNLRGMLEARTLTPLFSLDSHSKQACDESRLFQAFSFFYATHLTFPEHVHRFISLQGSPRGLERTGSEAF